MEDLQFYLNDFGDRYLYEVNRGAFNRLGAGTVFQNHFGDRIFRTDTLHIVVGTDSGLLPRHVRRRGVPDGCRYIFLELDALLPAVRAELESDEPDEAIQLTGQAGLAEALANVRLSDYASIGAVLLHESIGATDAYVADYRQVLAAIKQQLDAALWAYHAQLSNPSFVRCQLRNLIEEHVPAQTLRDSFRGRTALLLGGGPSLDDVLPWARTHRDQLVIFAVSRICRRLRQADLTPHVVVSIDPTELSFDISKELLLLDPRVVFAHANHVVSSLLNQWPGRSVYLDRRYPWDNDLDQANIGSVGPTVTNTAFALICAMGFGRIVFGGVDLCHSREGYTHAKGSNEHDTGPRLGGTGMRVPTNGGAEAETTPDFFNAIRSFGAQAVAARQAHIAVINPVSTAAVIAGVDHFPIDQIAVDDADADPFTILHRNLPTDSAALRSENLHVMQKELARANGRLRKVQTLAEEALECNAGLFGRDGRQAHFGYKKRMDKIERQLDRRYKDVSTIVRLFSAGAFLHMPPSDREWTDQEIEQAGRTYYTAYRDNAREVLRLVEEAQERVATALLEETQQPDFDRLLAQWEEDRLPGRGRVWRYRHPDLADRLTPAVAQRFEALDRLFEDSLQARDTTHLQKVRAATDLGPVRSRLQLLFREADASELAHVVHLLDDHGGPEADQLGLLARGYLAEIAGDDAAAFAHYAELIDLVRADLGPNAEAEPNPCLEDGLRRMVVIAMAEERHDQALLILETLTGFSPSYEPQFAELLRLSGDIEAAVTVYTDYLHKAPGDHVAMLRLGRLYQGLGARDAAETAFRYVLQQDPDNQAAQSLLAQLGTAA